MRYIINFGTTLEQSVIIMGTEVTEDEKIVYQVVIQFIDFVTVWTDATINEEGHLIGKQIITDSGEADFYEDVMPIKYLRELGYKKAAEQLEELEKFLGEIREKYEFED